MILKRIHISQLKVLCFTLNIMECILIFTQMYYILFLGTGNPFATIERTAVLQDARIFQQTPINPRKCCEILTKIIYLINQGEIMTTNEATETFFAMTKLFQSKDVSHYLLPIG